MKKAIILFVLFAAFAATAQKPKQSVAVYMAGTEPVAVKGAYKVLGAELAKSLAKSDNYTAVDRTDEVIKVLSAANIFKQDGAIDVDKARHAGKQLGAQIMCVAEITEVMKNYFLEARLVNVETAEISNVATAHGNMTAVDDVMRNAQAIATELTGGKVKLADFSFREIEANPDKAIREYTKAIAQEPDNAEYHYKRAYAYECKEEYDSAIADLTSAIRIDPKNALYYSARGYVYNDMGYIYNNMENFDKAISDFTEEIRLDPNDGNAYNNRGLAYAGKEDYDKAIADYNQSIRMDPDDTSPYNNRGNAYHNKGDFDRAFADFNQAIRLDPDDVKPYVNRGITFATMENYDKAIADFNQAIRMDPDNAEAYYNRGCAYKDKGDNDRAIADLETALRIDPDLPDAHRLIEEIRGGGKPAQPASPARPVQETADANRPDGLYYMVGEKAVPYVRYNESAEELNAPYVKRSTPAPSASYSTDEKRLGIPSMGSGLSYSNDAGGGMYGITDNDGWTYTTPWTGIGFHLFLDITYVEFGYNYVYYCFGKPKYGFGGDLKYSEDRYFYASMSGISVLGKYPVALGDYLSFFPAAGMEYLIVHSGALVYTEGEYEGEYEWDDPGDYSTLWFKFGAGLDISLGGKWFLRTEALYGFRLPSKYENDNVKENNADLSTGDDDYQKPAPGYGWTFRMGIGVGF